MRRSGSASCILRPKASLSDHDLRRLATEAPTATVLTVDRLSPCCTDRLYILGELNVHANAIRFLCDTDTSEGGSDAAPAFPPSIVLYLLWKPGTYPTPRSFADGPLSEAVRRCLLANGDDAPEEELEEVRISPKQTYYSPRRQGLPTEEQMSPEKLIQQMAFVGGDAGRRGSNSQTSESNDSPKQQSQREQLTKIYVVVDRISPSSDANEDVAEMPDFPDLGSPSLSYEEYSASTIKPMGDSSQSTGRAAQSSADEEEQRQFNRHNQEIRTAEQLARAVASSRFLRTRIDGISVGVASDARAAPGLEACMDTVARGAKERRMAARDRSVRKLRKRSGQKNEFDGDFYAGGDENMQHFRRKEKALERIREGSPERSPIAIVAAQPDDLEGTDHDHSHHHHHHSEHADASPSIMQCRVSTEWNGKGEHKTFADRAMGDWRQAWRVGAGGGGGESVGANGVGHGGIACRPRVPRIGGRDEVEVEEGDIDEPVSTIMVSVFLAAVAAYVWSAYGDAIMSFLFDDALEKG